MTPIRRRISKSLVSLILGLGILTLTNPSLSHYKNNQALPHQTIHLQDRSLVYERERLTVLTNDGIAIFYKYDPKTARYILISSESLNGEDQEIKTPKYYLLP